MTRKYDTQAIGDAAEQLACEYLQSQGLRLLRSKYRQKQGEIDLIMQDQEDIVFVEVRKRQGIDFGNALESITPAKINKLIWTARCYLQETKWLYTKTSRFDVVLLHPVAGMLKLEWIKNAFTYDRW